MRNRSEAPTSRLFEVATAEEWNSAEFGGYLDVWQALRHLASPENEEDDVVSVRVLPTQSLNAKRKAILEYARQLKLSVKTRHKDGWILIKDVTEAAPFREEARTSGKGIRMSSQTRVAQAEGAAAITVTVLLIYDRSAVPSDYDLICAISKGLIEEGHVPQEVLITGHEIAGGGEMTPYIFSTRPSPLSGLAISPLPIRVFQKGLASYNQPDYHRHALRTARQNSIRRLLKEPKLQSRSSVPMKRIASMLGTALLSAVIVVAIMTACGGSNSGGGNPLARIFTFNPNPLGLHSNSNPVASRLAESSFQTVVHAQSSSPGGGNFAGFCSTLNLVSGRAAGVIFGIGRWSDANCSDGSTPDSDVGVAIPQAGQIGNLTVDAIGTGTGTDSGDMEVKVIHSDGTQTVTTITCSLGVSNNAKVHCADADATHHTTVAAGDQVSARIFWNPGDTYRAIRVNVVYATPTF